MILKATNTSNSIYGIPITVEIWDKLGITQGFPLPFQILDPGSATLEDQNDKKNIFNQIISQSFSFTIIVEEHLDTLVDSLLTEEEGRYFVKVYENEILLYIGKIILADNSLSIEVNPALKISSTDGLADLKNKDFPLYDQYSRLKIKDVIATIMDKIEINEFITIGTKVFSFLSNLEVNSTYFSDNFLEITLVENYFYKFNEESSKREPISCYDVLLELMTRLHCSIKFTQGRWLILGHQNKWDGNINQIHNYDKNANLINSGFAISGTQSLNNGRILKGARNYFDSGIKKFTIETDVRFSDRQAGTGNNVELAYPTPISHSGQYIGYFQANAILPFNIKINIQSITTYLGPPPSTVKFRVQLKETSDTGVLIIYDKYFTLAAIVNGIYEAGVLPSAAYNRQIEAVYSVATASNPTTVAKFDLTTVITGDYPFYDKIEFTGTNTDSRNTKNKSIKQLGNNTTKNTSNFYYITGSAFDLGDFTKELRLSDSDDFTTLEEAVALHYLKKLTVNQKAIECVFNMKTYTFLDHTNRVTYNDEQFVLTSLKRRLYKSQVDLYGYKINDDPSATLSYLAVIPPKVAPGANTTNLSDGAAASSVTIYHKYVGVFNGNSYVIPDFDFPASPSFDSVRKSVHIFINGTKQTIIDGALSPIRQHEINVNTSTETITFPVAHSKARLEIFIYNYFITEIVA